uniref:Alpha-2-HS-glycoprotein 1 n=1 Tax=Cyprinus carpio carpio TaxID=630221 RepID=A0A9J7ZXC6_CYPCA
MVLALHVASLPTDTDVIYKCQEDQDNIATLAAVRFINDHHRHGYKFKFVSLDSRSADEKTDPCGVILGITLEETECHIVNPKPLDQCNTRMETETKVTAKCNVTVLSFEGKAIVACYICDTKPDSHEILVTKCPDCPILLPLNDPNGLESMKTALQKFNKESNHESYFKLLEVGRISTKWMLSGQGFFAQFAITETNCPKTVDYQKQKACKALCGVKARYGFCKSYRVGNEEPEVECEIYKAQNTTHPMKHPAQSRKDCKFHGFPPPHFPGHNLPHPEHASHEDKGRDKRPDRVGRPGHASHEDRDKRPDRGGRPGHASHEDKDRDKRPDRGGRPGHASHEDKGRDKRPDRGGRPGHASHEDKGRDKRPDRGGRPGHASHEDKGRDKKPDQGGRPEHARLEDKARDKSPDQGGRPERVGHEDKGRDKRPDRGGHPGHENLEDKGRDKRPDRWGRPEHASHEDKGRDKRPDREGRPKHTSHEDKGRDKRPEGRPEFPYRGFVKIPPSIYPICPFLPPCLCQDPSDHVPPSPPPPPPPPQ